MRARWNPNTHLFEFQDIITMIGARVRPTSLSVGPDDAVYVGFQRGNDVQRIVDPAGDLPQVEVVANLGGDGARSWPPAATRTARPPSTPWRRPASGSSPRTPACWRARRSRSHGLDPNTAIGAMYYDRDDDKLYVGTAAGLTEADAGIDTVIQVDTREGTATEFADELLHGGRHRRRPPTATSSSSTTRRCWIRPSPWSPAACSTSACPAPVQ